MVLWFVGLCKRGERTMTKETKTNAISNCKPSNLSFLFAIIKGKKKYISPSLTVRERRPTFYSLAGMFRNTQKCKWNLTRRFYWKYWCCRVYDKRTASNILTLVPANASKMQLWHMFWSSLSYCFIPIFSFRWFGIKTSANIKCCRQTLI